MCKKMVKIIKTIIKTLKFCEILNNSLDVLFSKLFDILQNFNVLFIALMIFTILLRGAVAPNEFLGRNILLCFQPFTVIFMTYFV